MRKYFMLIGFVLVFAGCSADLAQRCAEQFPCRDSVIVKQKVLHDTIQLGPWWIAETDSVPCPPSDTGIMLILIDTVFVPKFIKIVEWRYKDTCIVQHDSAREAYLKQIIAQLQTDLKERENDVQKALRKAEKGKPYKWISWLLILALVALLGYIVTRSLKFKL